MSCQVNRLLSTLMELEKNCRSTDNDQQLRYSMDFEGKEKIKTLNSTSKYNDDEKKKTKSCM